MRQLEKHILKAADPQSKAPLETTPFPLGLGELPAINNGLVDRFHWALNVGYV